MVKINHTKIIIDGIEFASISEGKRYRELKLMERSGDIKDLVCHPKFLLIPKKKPLRELKYTGDFEYWDCKRGMLVLEDVKNKWNAKDAKFSVIRRVFYFITGRIIEVVIMGGRK